MRNFITWLRNKAARATILLEIRTNNGIWSLRPYWLEQETNYRVCIGMVWYFVLYKYISKEPTL